MKPKRLETGYTLTQENFNSIVDMISKLENKEVLINDDTMSFLEGDDFEGSIVSVNRDSLGRIESITQEVKETADRTPFQTFDEGLSFEHELVYNVDNSSDFQVLRKDNGTIISRTNFSLNNKGVISFGTAHDEEFVLVSGLDYWITKTMYIGRDEDGNIVKLSMNPITSVKERKEQDLLPVLMSNRDEVDMDVFQGGTEYLTGAFRTFNKGKDTGYPNAGNRLYYLRGTEITIDFKQRLEFSRIELDGWMPNLIGEGDIPKVFSFDIWGSNDKSTWERVLRVRNFTENDNVPGKQTIYEFKALNPRAFQYLKFEGLGPKQLDISWLRFLGYHPDGIDMKNNEPLVKFFRENAGDYNGSVRITAGNKGKTEDTLRIERLTGWESAGSSTIRFGSYIQYEFNEPTILEKYKFEHHYHLPQEWKWEGSNDGENFETIDERENYDWRANDKVDDYGNEGTIAYHIDKPRSFRFYRLVPLVVPNKNETYGDYCEIQWLELSGRRA